MFGKVKRVGVVALGGTAKLRHPQVLLFESSCKVSFIGPRDRLATWMGADVDQQLYAVAGKLLQELFLGDVAMADRVDGINLCRRLFHTTLQRP